MRGRRPLFDAPMSATERQRRLRDKAHPDGEHVAQFERACRAAHAFTDAIDSLSLSLSLSLSKTYARLEQEHGGSKAFAAWLRKNKQDALDAEDRNSLVAMGQGEASAELHEMLEAGDSPLSAAAILQWVKERRKGKAKS